ncbi:hypothetical protein QUB63_35470, partial [Microcoleus sp. ARI1-B5]|uniref:hypothetical protein n=1 Tax=unclassified Microcoleus TaxID=2642155 RepID=UPI002FD2E3BA
MKNTLELIAACILSNTYTKWKITIGLSDRSSNKTPTKIIQLKTVKPLSESKKEALSFNKIPGIELFSQTVTRQISS